MKDKETVYSTADIGLAAFAMTHGIRLKAVAGSAGTRRRFVFEPGEDPRQWHVLLNGYFNGALVPARAFANNLRDLKARLYA